MHAPDDTLSAPPRTPAICARNLCKSYHIFSSPKHRLRQTLFPSGNHAGTEFRALHDLTLDIPHGQTLGVIGRNGSGKSTLLQLLCGTLTPSAGSITANGRIAAILELGAGFHPEFTGRENIRLAAQVYGLSPRQIAARLNDIIQFADLPERFIDQPVKTYSSGMYVRLAFAIIAHVEADILLIDEALAVGDVFFVQKCFRFLRDFQNAGKTVVLVSHDAAALQSLCHQVLWLEAGRRQELGSPKVVLRNYLAAAHGFPPSATASTRETRSGSPPSQGYGANGATIESITLTDEHHSPLASLTANHDAILTIRARANRDLSRVILGFFLKDRLGQNIFGENTHGTHPNLAAGEGEAITATFRFKMPTLPAGEYTVTAALAEGTQDDHQIQHWLHDALTLTSLCRNDALGLVGIPMGEISLTSGERAEAPTVVDDSTRDPAGAESRVPDEATTVPPIALTTPALLSDYSAWIPHIPLAFTTIALLRPRTFVELGTHKGDSYCAFCQAIALLNLPTKATAVDTWAGDESAGFYSPEVLETLRRHHDARYAHFSTLLQSKFSDAAKNFPPRSIDLLHIDGAHDYASARSDFDTYRPLLSDRSVVLLHDTNAPAMGVQKLWQELRRDYPHFEFPHAYGLGILVTGKNVPQEFTGFVVNANRNPEEIRQLYGALGDRLESQRTLNLLTTELSAQARLSDARRRSIGAPALPDFPDPACSDDPKAYHDRLAWFAATFTGDFRHATKKP